MTYMKLIQTFLTFLGASCTITSALDKATMETLIQKELDTFHPWSLSAFMELWSQEEEGTLCLEDRCLSGLEDIEEFMSGFSNLLSETCDMQEECYFMEGINKAACRFSCLVTLRDNPGCVSDPSNGIVVYEWNDDGRLVRMEDFLSNEAFSEAVAPCIKEADNHLRGSNPIELAMPSVTAIQ
mmetsp:Transcript_23196/g.39650  ORF Transcript_23196/g.39650 Transcript_23196/m.39650 type:complete len:183 (+) Transcript_23196:163-711(+)|eukprot:CAMPEP_0183712962 /NCGR_PEP_ID=MMETSP0737-20130205/7988_1 /TAXON_ID=385413 /ORGANISM="Thalassiosira miniscula, Strain CCMP1093" /LENGTH=182 /DNA_ID=CAMNT_0025941701 /DNA_START=134 /DNA_END=682 /DNA_ORIENTATION=-